MLTTTDRVDMIATFGARLFSSDTPKSIGLIVKAGHDFPLALEQTFETWNVDLHILREDDKPSPRGRILYGQNSSERTYQRLTPSLPSTIEDLTATNMISAACFHFFDVPETVNAQIDQITALRAQKGIQTRPLFIWEPQAKSCSPETFELHRKVIEKVDIFSPNHAELASFFPQPPSGLWPFDQATIEEQARTFMPASPSHALCIMVRCAEHGCFSHYAIPNGEENEWLPAEHLPGSDKVVDTTGAGNAFLGGAAIGYLQHQSFSLAAVYGSVAASFAVETVGLPEVAECDAEARLSTYLNWVINLRALAKIHNGS
jgi:sugar/nucleoside kinase (ribokinase family)